MKIPGGFQSVLKCLGIRDYRLYVTGNVTHGLAIWIFRTSIGWLAWELTESTAWLGAMAMAETAPSLILAPFAGTVVDRINYFRLMQISQGLAMLLALILAVLTLSGSITIWALFFLVLFRGCLMAFNRPSRMALIHYLVGRDLLAPALAIGSIIHNGTRFIGPALGGLIIVSVGNGWGFAAASALLLVYTVILMVMRVSIEPEKRERRSMLAETKEGITYAMTHPGIRLQLALLVMMGMAAKPVTDLLPGFAGQVFSMGADGLAMLLSANGIGATCGAVWLASRPSGIDGMSRISILSVLFLSANLMLFVATDIFWMGLVFSALLGGGFIILTVTSQTLIQSAVDPAFRGRVISVHGLVVMGVPALGAMLLGGLAEHFGLRIPVFAGGVLCLVMWAATWHRREALKASLETAPAGQ
jgi:MFS family permease